MLSEYNLFKMDFVKNTVNLQNTLELKYNNKIVWNINLKYNLLKLLSTKLDMLGPSLLYCNNNVFCDYDDKHIPTVVFACCYKIRSAV